MPSLAIQYNPSVGPLVQVAIWLPNYIPPSQQTPHSPVHLNMYNALVDTGASFTCISRKVIQDLNLTPIGKQQVGHAQGSSATNSYQFQVVLPFPSHKCQAARCRLRYCPFWLWGSNLSHLSAAVLTCCLEGTSFAREHFRCHSMGMRYYRFRMCCVPASTAPRALARPARPSPAS
jgi:Aspartyl protease